MVVPWGSYGYTSKLDGGQFWSKTAGIITQFGQSFGLVTASWEKKNSLIFSKATWSLEANTTTLTPTGKSSGPSNLYDGDMICDRSLGE